MSAPGGVDEQRADALGAQRVELHLPVDPKFRLLARMSGSAIASQVAFGVDDIEDLRLAIDELCTSCSAGVTPRSRLLLTYSWDDESVRLECAVDGVEAEEPGASPAPGSLSEDELSERILAALTDAHGIEAATDGRRSGWFVKRRSATAE